MTGEGDQEKTSSVGDYIFFLAKTTSQPLHKKGQGDACPGPAISTALTDGTSTESSEVS